MFVLMCLRLVRTTLTMISIPPVVAPALNTSASATPIKAPPSTDAISRSLVTAPCAAKVLIKTVINASTYIVEKINRHPNFHSPSRTIGMLMSILTVPVGIFVKRFTRMEMPVTPPGAILLGSRNRLIAAA